MKGSFTDTCLQCGWTRTYSRLGELVVGCRCGSKRQVLKPLKNPNVWSDVQGLFDPNPTGRPASKAKAKNKGRTAALLKIQQLYIRDGRRCWHCGRVLRALDDLPKVEGKLPSDYPTLDHIIPRSRGGHARLDNLVVACPSCNNRRGDGPTTRIPRPGVQVVHHTSCPDCTNGTWAETDGRFCPTCEGAGQLSVERARALFVEQRRQLHSAREQARHAKHENVRLRDIVENEMGPGSSRRRQAERVAAQLELIHRLADRILELKIELAEATGADLKRMVGNQKSYERALRIVEERSA